MLDISAALFFVSTNGKFEGKATLTLLCGAQNLLPNSFHIINPCYVYASAKIAFHFFFYNLFPSEDHMVFEYIMLDITFQSSIFTLINSFTKLMGQIYRKRKDRALCNK